MDLLFGIVEMGRNPYIAFPKTCIDPLPGKILENMFILALVAMGEKHQT